MAFSGEGALGGAGTGATLGSFAGPVGSAVGAGLGAVAGGIFGRKKETGLQKKQRNLVDDLLASLKGQGTYNDLFNADEASFQKSFVDPAKARFNNQIAPQIQQNAIASGQQRGSGLDDTLTRAGVDLDQLLNEHYMNYQQGAQNRQSSAISNILGQPGSGAQSVGEGASQGFAGYLSSSGFKDDLANIFGNKKQPIDSMTDTYKTARKGFEADQQEYV